MFVDVSPAKISSNSGLIVRFLEHVPLELTERQTPPKNCRGGLRVNHVMFISNGRGNNCKSPGSQAVDSQQPYHKLGIGK